ncbi:MULTISPECIES: hypothetical protein [Bradyrhizobium]|uniref:Uncharacterized protein n=2 Tax=Bradyrhizobium frederickii TaxID=2560054 RepID=A0A4Y9KSZ8_9BRAD|nr:MULTISPECIES: hypothetical protein [Bradyrhizobium]TFV28670.1 hypothetical protein E4K66_38635 [Bradyrhizobium frederickii]
MAEARPPDPGPVSGGGRNYHPHLSAEHRDIIDKAIAQYAAQKNPKPTTVKRYTQVLRRLGNHLGAHRQKIDLGDHESLVRHVKTYFPNDEGIKKGLSVLRAYHDPSYVASGGRPRTIPSADDAPLSERLNASGMTSGSAARHDRSLRRFSNALNLAGHSISGLDHAARIEFAQKLFPKDEHLLFALNKVGDAEHVAEAGPSRKRSGHAVPSRTLHLHPDDARIIDGLEKAELSMLKPEETRRRKDVQDLAGNQRRFGAWLQSNGRGSIVSRLTGTSEQQKSLNDDHTDFKKLVEMLTWASIVFGATYGSSRRTLRWASPPSRRVASRGVASRTLRGRRTCRTILSGRRRKLCQMGRRRSTEVSTLSLICRTPRRR